MKIVSARPYSEMCRLFAEECQRLAQETFDRYCRNLSEPVYLCGTRGAQGAIWETLSVASEAEIDARDAIDYVRTEPLPRHLTRDHLASVVKDWLRTEPLWCFAD